MKKLVLFLVLISLFCFESNSQNLSKRQLRDIEALTISVGVNAVGSLGTQNPFERLGEFEFRQPLAVAIQHRWTRYLSIEQDFTLNKFNTTSTIDNGSVPENFNYFSTNTYLKYYFSDEFLPNTTWLDLYTGGGLGIFSVDEVNVSGNFVLGGIIWVSPSVGLSLQGVGKFAFNHKESRYDTNHFQYMLYAVFKI
jgi:hypothetical protein